MSQTGSTSRTVGSLGSSTDSTVGSVNNQKGDFGKKHRKIIRILTVVAYIMSVSTAALLLSAYYVFLWDPKEPDPNSLVKRPTDSPSTLAHRAYTSYPQGPGNSNYKDAYGGYAYSTRHISQALNAPYPSEVTPKTTRTSRKGYTNYYNTKPTLPQIPTPQSLIMQKILTSTTPSHRTEPLGLGVGSPPDDPKKRTKSMTITTPETPTF